MRRSGFKVICVKCPKCGHEFEEAAAETVSDDPVEEKAEAVQESAETEEQDAAGAVEAPAAPAQ